MQYMLPWRERVMGSSSDYEAAQDRARALWDPLTWPDSLVVVNAVSRLDGYGASRSSTLKAHALHTLILTFAAYTFEVVPVMDFHESLDAKLRVLEWRDVHST